MYVACLFFFFYCNKPNLMVEILTLNGPCQTIYRINQGAVVGHYLLGIWSTMGMDE